MIPTDLSHVATYAGVGTAAGTLALAVATFVLARGTRDDVAAANRQAEASSEQARASTDQAKASSRQAEVAERALIAQMAPLLTDVPYGIPTIVGYRKAGPSPPGPFEGGRMLASAMFDNRPREPDFRDASRLTIEVWENRPNAAARFSVPLRNVGNGAAIIHSVQFVITGTTGFTGSSSSPVVPQGEVAQATLIVPPEHHAYAEAKGCIEKEAGFSVVVGYGDASGNPFGATRLDVHAEKRSNVHAVRWYVRQVFWDDTADDVLRNPRLGSQPVD